MIIQYLINGLLLGSMYALIGVSIVIVYKSTKVFNFASGSLMTTGGLICLTLLDRFKMPLLIAIILAMLVLGTIAIVIERFTLRPLLAQPIFTLIMATLLLDRIFYGINAMFWSGYIQSFPPDIMPGETIHLDSLFISHELLYAFIAAMISFVFLGILFKKTAIGLKMRSTAESHDVAMSVGINIKRIFGISWALAAIIGVLAGVLLGNRLGLHVSLTPALAFKAVPAIILGGLESILGIIIGGLIVGVLEQLSGGFLGSEYMEVTPYLILLIVLIFKPEGLFGIKRIERI